MSEVLLPPNEDQELAIKVILGFLASTEEKFMVLEGAGGTGKTFVVKHVVRALEEFHKTRKLLGMKGQTRLPVVFTATTNKACEAMQTALMGLNANGDGGLSDVLESHPSVGTIHSHLGLVMRPDPENPAKYMLADREPEHIAGKSLIFIDEASYINEELWDWIQKKTSKDTKVVFIGDPAQLKNSSEKRLPAFDSGFRKAVLRKVERFDTDTPIYEYSVLLRERILAADWRIPPLPIDGNYIRWYDRVKFDQIMFSDMSNSDWTFMTSKFLAYRNNRVQTYNKGLNEAIQGSRHFKPGDYAVNNHYVSGTKASGGIRTDGLVFIDKVVPNNIHGEDGFTVYLDGLEDRAFFMPNDHKAIAKVERRMLREYEKAIEDKEKVVWLRQLNTVRDTWVDLRPVYAQTIFKSQGSTFRRVYIDLADIGFSRDRETTMRMLYVACTRARKQLFITGAL